MMEDDGFGIDNDLGSSEQLLIATEAPEMVAMVDQRRQGCWRNA